MKRFKIIKLASLAIITTLLFSGIFIVKPQAEEATDSQSQTNCTVGAKPSVETHYGIDFTQNGDNVILQASAPFTIVGVDEIVGDKVISSNYGGHSGKTFSKAEDGKYTYKMSVADLKDDGKDCASADDDNCSDDKVLHITLKRKITKADAWDVDKACFGELKTFDKSYVEVITTIDIDSYDSSNFGEEESKNYSSSNACKFLRYGKSSGIKFDEAEEKYEQYWNGSDDAQKSYKEDVPFCYDGGTTAIEYSDSDLKILVQRALFSYYLHSVVIPSDNVGGWTVSMVRSKAENVGGKHFQTGVTSISQPENLKCDYTKLYSLKNGIKTNDYDDKPTDTEIDNNQIANDAYFQNREYYYASSPTSSSKTYSYVYHYDKGNGIYSTQTKEFGTCKRTCEEAVIVEYGPPQAALAGLCIEYKVKVTSKVNCSTNLDFKKDEQNYKLCVPRPRCVHGKTTIDQAGPSEEFDACIQKCDGGKYSQDCSKKCYNQVYLLSNKLDLSETLFSTSGTYLTDSSVPAIFQGYHYRDKDGNILWKSTGGVSSYATYYYKKKYNKTVYWNGGLNGSKRGTLISKHHKYYTAVDGFKKSIKNGVTCKDKCKFVGCGANTYLDEEKLKADKRANLKIYNDALTECVAAATCRESTATFSFEVSYKHKDSGNNVVKETIKYPYTTKQDKLESKSDTSDRTQSLGKDSTILGYAGCYVSGKAKNYYMTKWSFPGTWVNNKTGEISFEDKSSDVSWHTVEDKFCLPLDTENVNEQWWKYYMARKTAENNTGAATIDTGSYLSESYKNKCNDYTAFNSSLLDGFTPEYNIKAQTTEFGYFGWKFDVSCFYASYNGSSDICPKGKCDSCTTSGYDTRTVEATDLFPSKDGSKIESSTSSSTSVGRDPGFNWTSAASIPSKKNTIYAVNPRELIDKIQEAGNKIYSEENKDEYLDYEFNLTSSDLNKIKQKYGSDDGYVTWSGESVWNSEANVYTYNSELLDELKSSGALKKSGIPGCNNEARGICVTNVVE